jgi:DNA gyrase/topoisomerase IV subunit A
VSDLPATGKHQWNEGVVTKEPTATESGIKTFTCKVCQATKTEDIPKVHTHDYTRLGEIIEGPYCETEGKRWMYCSYEGCNERVLKPVPAIGYHDWDTEHTECLKKATCTEKGTMLIELEAGTQLLHYFAGPANATLLLSSSGGYGFLAAVENMVSRQKGGKAFISLGEGETVCVPSHAAGTTGSKPLLPATHVACASVGGRILTFEITELKTMANGGRGLMLIDLEDKDQLAGAAAYTRSIRLDGIGRGGKVRDETLEIRSLNNARAARGRKGKAADLGFKPNAVTRVE